ncbi:MAG: 2-oxo acid dehydrogenase subunit E2 [Acidimicrobiia bacterium]|nr:2-oxo acid dehydrogenase subunit E2 [Acidimicrobiia bacterium]
MAYELNLHDLGEGLTEAEVIGWLVAVGEPVTAGQPIVEVETAKTTAEITAPRAGVLLHQGAAPGDTLVVGGLLAVIGDPAENWTPPSVTAAPEATGGATTGSPSADTVKAMPVVRKLATELGVDLASVTGTGPGGAITRQDVEAAAASGAETGGERLSATRRAISDHLTRSWSEIPHVTVWGPASAGALLAARSGGGPMEAWLAAAVIPLLGDHPDFNAGFDGSHLRRSAAVHLGFAVHTDAGLVVPVVRDAETRSHDELVAQIERLAVAAQDRTLTPTEVAGPTFTLSNVGAVGGGYGTPIIPHGTTAILSVGRARDEAVVVDGAVTVAPVFPLALSFDHRVIDGAAGAAFLNAVTDRIAGFGGDGP